MRLLRPFLFPALAGLLALYGCDSSTNSPAPADSPNDGASFAKALLLRTDDSTVWTSVPAKAETLWTRFDAVKGLTYRWSLTGAGTKGTIRFGDAVTASRIPAPGKEGVSLVDSLMVWRCDSTEVVYLPLVVLDSLAKVGGHGRPEIGGVAMDTWEPELSVSDRPRLPWDSLVTRTLTTDDTDWFVLPAIDSGSLEFSAKGCEGAVLEWFDRKGTLVGSGTVGKNGYARSLRPWLDSSVLLRVRHVFTGSTGSYSVLAKHGYPLRLDPYDPDEGGWFTGPDSKDTLVLDGAPHKRSLESKDYDYAVLWADSGKDYQITARSNRSLKQTLFNPAVNGSRSSTARDGGLGSKLDGQIRFVATKTGYFRLDIEAEAFGDSTDYSLEYRSVAPLAADANDPADDVRSGAQSLALDAWSGGNLIGSDKDWFSAPVTPGKSYVLTVDAQGGTHVDVWSTSDTTKSFLYQSLYGIDSVWFTADSSRSIKIELNGDSYSGSQRYWLKLSELAVLGPDSHEPDSTIATAGTLNADSSARTAGTLSLNDVDVYKVPCDSGTTCTVTYWGPKGSTLEWIDADGKALSVSTWFGNLGVPEPTLMTSYKQSSSASVYIRVHPQVATTPSRGTYILRLSKS